MLSPICGPPLLLGGCLFWDDPGFLTDFTGDPRPPDLMGDPRTPNLTGEPRPPDRLSCPGLPRIETELLGGSLKQIVYIFMQIIEQLSQTFNILFQNILEFPNLGAIQTCSNLLHINKFIMECIQKAKK